jgi:hypothetical protein
MSALTNLTRRTFLLAAGASPLLRGQSLLRREWTAKWIAVPKAPKTEYGVYHFRKTFDLPARPERFLVHTSGDNRYQLFVNGQRVAWGPARGDLFHWRYETVDIAGFLRPGKNLLAAIVWNFGQHAPEAQITLGQAAIYMATAPKSNASAMAIWGAMADVREGRTIPVPRHLRDTHYKGAARLGHGKDYKYAHDFEGGVAEQDYLGVEKTYYEPTDRGFEVEIGRRLGVFLGRQISRHRPDGFRGRRLC